jgi:predicted SAM-dependent methyltransferase
MLPDQIEMIPHMPVIEEYASHAAVVIELGVGDGNGSTRAIARGLDNSPYLDKLHISVDIEVAKPKERPTAPYWHMVHGDSRLMGTVDRAKLILGERKADLIYIDTDHTYEQMQCELEVWSTLARPDTIWLFHDTWMFGPYNHMTDAIKEFAAAHPPLTFIDLTHESHGLGLMRPFVAINLGSGQRPFKPPFLNSDIQEKWKAPTEAAGCLWVDEKVVREGKDRQCDIIVLHHVLEHFGCGDADGLIENCWRLLKPGGSLLVFVPDMRALARRWLTHQMDTQLYITNVYGAYMGDEHDRHRWGYDYDSLYGYLTKWYWRKVVPFDWRTIEGAGIAKDWWILGLECIR